MFVQLCRYHKTSYDSINFTHVSHALQRDSEKRGMYSVTQDDGVVRKFIAFLAMKLACFILRTFMYVIVHM